MVKRNLQLLRWLSIHGGSPTRACGCAAAASTTLPPSATGKMLQKPDGHFSCQLLPEMSAEAGNWP